MSHNLRIIQKHILSIIIILVKLKNISSLPGDFQIYWNIPSFMCRKYNIYTENTTKQFGIIQNHNDEFRGDQIAILYDPGKFPAILKDKSPKTKLFYRNKGVPQEGNLFEHLQAFGKHIDEFIPNKNFSGLGVIDFESWRPVYRQNFGTLKPYKDLSYYIETQRYPYLSQKLWDIEASKRFEKYGRIFMEETIILAKKLRPQASWGYYGFPHCFNGRNNETPEPCAAGVEQENNRIQWLFDLSDIILPSVYLNEAILPSNRIPLVKGRIQEAIRLAKYSTRYGRSQPKTFAYHRYVYPDTTNFLTESDNFGLLNTIKNSEANGVIFWGSSNDLNSRAKCEAFISHLKNEIGPVIDSLKTGFSVIN